MGDANGRQLGAVERLCMSLSALSLLNALDIQNHRFATQWRGYDVAEVDRFFALVGEQTGSLTARIAALEVDLAQRDLELQQAQSETTRLQGNLRLGDAEAAQVRAAARHEAAELLREADAQASERLSAAAQEAKALREQVERLRQQRQQLLEDMRGVVSTHARLLDVIEASEPATEAQAGPRVLVRLGAPPPPESDGTHPS